MIKKKTAFSIKIRKTSNFDSIFGGQGEENSNKNRFKHVLFLSIAFSAFFLQFWLRFGTQKSLIKKSQKFEKIEVRRPPLKQYRF